MDILHFIIAASPVLLVAVLVICWKLSALSLSLWGILYTSCVAYFAFNTSLAVVFLGALDGVITTLPLLLTVFFGIILSALLIGTGALARIVQGLSKGFRNPMHQVNGITFGVENFMAGAGIITEPIIAPTLKAVGLRSSDAAVLACWGYAGIMSFTLAGVFVVILSIITGMEIQKLAVMTALVSLVPTVIFGIAMPAVMEDRGLAKRHFFLNAGVALACGVFTLLFVTYVSYSTACMLAGIALLAGMIVISRSVPDFRQIRLVDVLPFLILIVCLSVVNMYPPLRDLAGNRWVISVSVVPVHRIEIKPVMDAYTYLIIAIIMTVWGLRIKTRQFISIIAPALPRAAKAIVAMMVFGAMGQIVALSGYQPESGTFVLSNNIPYVLADGLSKVSGRFYPLFAPFLGWMGTFLTGYGSLSVMLFGKLQVEIARFINVSPEIVATAMMVGSGIGSISSPFKIAMATSLVGATGKEGHILRKTIPIGIAISLITGLWAYVLIYFVN